MKAMKHNGLVQVEVKKPFRSYHEGQIVRLSPADAFLYEGSGHVTEAKLPKGVAAETIAQPDDGFVSDKILPNPVPAIPDGWEGEHILQRRKLAEQIAGGTVKPEEVDSIIRRELERRLTE
ncbi:hypothetical protein FHR70_001660 [Microvirga lupini]|uniref:Uncharacterized protein n=1 Tax=Microvirga lupini TaxID=420324 RepID=A0A7W4YW74_9HYPH|nr:hypothetical protein [Microvirga lupini]MBB3018606.1 hypothetical protein [Microvirga lupini]